MFTIHIYHKEKKILKYQSNVEPAIGDKYASPDMPDFNERTVIDRIISPKMPDNIIVNVDYSYPSLAQIEPK